MNFSHCPVMINEVIESFGRLSPRTYLDLTAGGGGHAAHIINKFNGLSAVLLDRDGDAVSHLQEKFKDNPRVTVVKSKSSDLDRILFLLKIKSVDLILADLGVSSHQFDTPERGFSIMKDGPLDMRMDKTCGQTALDLIKNSKESFLKEILSSYAQEREANKIARVLKKCAEEGMTSTFEFARAIRNAKKYGKKGIDPATQVFMALRMEVNNEMGELETMLKKGFSRLSSIGAMGVISFHSTEDRAVKNFFRNISRKMPYYINEKDTVPYIPEDVVLAGPFYPGESEISENPRSRSAKLRVIFKGGFNFNK